MTSDHLYWGIVAASAVVLLLWAGRRWEQSKERRRKEAAESDLKTLMCWTMVLDVRSIAPVPLDTAKYLTKALRTDLDKALLLLGEARREWASDQGPSPAWYKQTTNILEERGGRWLTATAETEIT